MATAVFTLRDHSDELSTVAFPVAEPAADGSNYAAVITAMGNILLAIQGMTIGEVQKWHLRVLETIVSSDRPSNEWAQRETGARLFWQEDAAPFAKGYVTVPTADLNLIASPGTDILDLAGVTVINTLVALLEANMSTVNGNSVTFYRGTVVGRNN